MKKEIFALLTIIFLIIAAVINILYLQSLIEKMDVCIQEAYAACEIEDFGRAEAALSTALQYWLEADNYTHVFIRHSEIDSTTDAYHEALESILCEDQQAASATLGKLSYHLKSILSMEYVTLRSVF